jgi:hypothetical protein
LLPWKRWLNSFNSACGNPYITTATDTIGWIYYLATY